MLTCADCAKLLPDIIDGNAKPALYDEFIYQTKQREKCRHCYETYKKSAKLMRIAYTNSEPSQPCEELLKFLRNRLVP
ncbi:MAG: hypothetical protein JW841_12450 [Deltaproteobacteria bacterium]|nr:hypothetical protein [Deltaproteobacteria bacterium]